MRRSLKAWFVIRNWLDDSERLPNARIHAVTYYVEAI